MGFSFSPPNERSYSPRLSRERKAEKTSGSVNPRDMAQFHKKAETPFVTKDEASYQLCFFCMESLGKREKERRYQINADESADFHSLIIFPL